MQALVSVAVSIGLLATVIRLWPGPCRPDDEARVWRLMLTGVLSVALAALLAPLLERKLLPGILSEGSVGTFAGPLACAPFYQGLIRWNRTRTRTSDPGDWLNGMSAVLIAVALGNLALDQLPGGPAPVSGFSTQVSLFGAAAAVMLLGTSALVSVIGGLLRDPRIWLVVLAMVLLVTGELTVLRLGPPAASMNQALWLLAGSVITLSAALASRPGSVRPATNQATIIGSLLVLLAGVGVLTVNNDLVLPGNRLATGYAAAGVLLVSLRVLRLVRDLAHLARTRHEAMTDELTGVANRRALLTALDDQLARPGSTSLMIVDLDRFKAINDRYGHAAGDLLLRHTATAFAAHVPAGGLLARLGGDEFAVLLAGTDPAQAAAVARRLAQAAAPLSDVKGRLLQVGASVGVATTEQPGMAGGELMRRADAAMYRAKTCGSGVKIYDSALDAADRQRLDLVEDLARVLAANSTELQVHFQPQVDLATGVVVGAEALARWQHPRLGLLAPESFIELAEQNGLMPGLTAHVLREAAEQAARWRAHGFGLRVSVNLSAGCLAHAGLLPLIDELLSEGLSPENLVLEVTETSLMSEPEQALTAMRRLAGRGVGISIDDYGTGYSSLSYLNDLPATELKIDRSFTAGTVRDPRTAAIVGATVELAHRLGMRLVAEGVEDEPTLVAMRELGCDESQGWLHGRPLEAEEFMASLARSTVRARVAVG